ncbi:lumican-like [Halictus rubicundus]|uniref:lumican-like n=1 Tax=Halictus rubicundus TaxID=77578 RepID=UPI004036935C
MVLPYILILTFLIPEYHTIRVINYGSDIDENTDNLVIRRHASVSCEGEESVSFNNFSITKIPATAIISRTIQNINLQNNLLNKIPTELFDNVPLMECLNVAGNRIPYVEIFNFGHSKLKTLIVDYQNDVDQFDMLQTQFHYTKSHFPKLERLHVNGISTVVLDRFPKDIFPQLTTLYLTDNAIRNIEKNFISGLPTSLQHLHLERNAIHQFNVYNVGNLMSLYLDQNPLRSIYISSNDTYLEILSLRDCNLNSQILQNLRDFPLSNLNILDISENHLKYIPDNLFNGLTNLQQLLLRKNSITEIPNLNNFHRLYKLSLSYNDIETVSNVMSNTLRILNLQNNKISEIIDSSFTYLPMLQVLDLSNNKLEYLAPGWAHSLQNLEQLNLKFNMFAKITDISLASLVDLRNLYIKGNLFHEIDEHDIQLIPQNCTTYVA